MKLLSVIVPCHNEEKTLPLFLEELKQVSRELPARLELILVDDGSQDLTLTYMHKLAQEDERIHYLSFTRNFGKEAAMLAGLRASSGDWVCIMDADLQDPPELLPRMFQKLLDTGADCAAARRISRDGEPPVRSLCSRLFYRLFSRVSGISLCQGERDFRLMSRSMVTAVLALSERVRFTKGIFSYVGYSTCWVEFEHIRRASGKSSWSLGSLSRYALDGIASFSSFLLWIPFLFAFLSLLIFLGSLVWILQSLAHSQNVQDTAILCLAALFSACLFLTLGAVCFYLSRIYLEVKRRPLYFIRERR